MAHTNDSEVARLAEMVASLAVQLAALSPSTDNSNATPAAAPAPASAPAAAAPASAPAAVAPAVAPAAAVAPASAPLAPVASVASPREPATLGCEDYGEDSLSATSSAHRRWYIVIVGLQVGVFRGWTNTAPLVLGVAGSIYNREPTREAAIFAFNAAAAIGQVRLVD